MCRRNVNLNTQKVNNLTSKIRYDLKPTLPYKV